MSDAVITQESLDQAITQTIAKEILRSLDTPHRDALLERSITSALKDWGLKRDIEKVVANRAQEVAAELVTQESWTARITQAVEEGLTLYISHLPHAVYNAIKEALHGHKGKDSYHDRMPIILRHLNVPEPEKK